MTDLQRQLRDLILASEGKEAGFMAEDRIITLNRLLMALGNKYFYEINPDEGFKRICVTIRMSEKLITTFKIDLTHTNILDNDESVLAKLVDLLTNK